MGGVFYWIGATVVGMAALSSIGVGLAWLYFNLIADRFQLIFFKEGKRRLSLASWHQSRIIHPGTDDRTPWPADDYPIGTRPFFLSYKMKGRQFFIMAGSLSDWRNNSIEGKHP